MSSRRSGSWCEGGRFLLLAFTGATGFLGRRAVEAAQRAGHRVRALVTRGDTTADEVVRGALDDRRALAWLVRGTDAVVHLAAVGVQSRDRSWEKMLEVNVAAPLALVELTAAASVGTLVAAGTSLEYAGHGRLPSAPWDGRPVRCAEDALVEPADPYGAVKAAGGVLLRAKAREAGLPCWYLRFASLYGPGDDPGKLLPSAVAAAAERRAFEMTPGEQVRDWLHVDDAAESILFAVTRPAPADGTIVNVGTGEGVALVDLVRRVFRLGAADPSLVRAGTRPYRAGEAHHLVLDVSRAEHLLGWNPRIPLDTGLAGLVGAAR